MSEVITLNVGGVIYPTTLSTLTKYPESMLGAIFSGNYTPTSLDANGHHFIDRDGRMFCYVLNFLRSNELCLPNDFQDFALLETEVNFYQIPALFSAVQELKKKPSKNKYSGCILEVTETKYGTRYLTISGPKEILEKLPLPPDALGKRNAGDFRFGEVSLYNNPNVPNTSVYHISDYMIKLSEYLGQNHWQLHTVDYSLLSSNRETKYVWCMP